MYTIHYFLPETHVRTTRLQNSETGYVRAGKIIGPYRVPVLERIE
jgi:hypothetical protein